MLRAVSRAGRLLLSSSDRNTQRTSLFEAHRLHHPSATLGQTWKFLSAATDLRCVLHSSAMPPQYDQLLEQAEVTWLTGKQDLYDGLILDPLTLPPTPEQFAAELPAAIQRWREHGYRGIWLRIPTTKAHFVGHAVDEGFEFHHAEKDYIMLTNWLPDEENKLPPNASHQVGIGAFVLNERREVLVVQEKLGPLRGTGVWKMPTGLVQAGEDISAAAEREVLEETGVRARFNGVLAMRQAHGFAFGKSDFFFVVALKPESGQQELKMQEDELVGVQWMPLEDYVSIPFTQSRPLLAKIADKCLAYANGTYQGLVGRKMATGSSHRQDLLLFGEETSGEGNPDDLWIGLGNGARKGGE